MTRPGHARPSELCRSNDLEALLIGEALDQHHILPDVRTLTNRRRPGAGHFTAMTNSAVIGGKTSFSLSGTRNEKHRCCNQEATIHD